MHQKSDEYILYFPVKTPHTLPILNKYHINYIYKEKIRQIKTQARKMSTNIFEQYKNTQTHKSEK